MAKKGNSKSIRLSDEVLAYIESYEGKGFNEKFENIILYAMRTEIQRKEHIQHLDEVIASKKKILSDLNDLSSQLHHISYYARNLQTISDSLDIFIEKAKNVTRND